MSSTTAGMVCAHHHLYSSLARGMPAPPHAPQTFLGVLQNVWWRLDAALDLEMIYWSAALGAAEALASGTTCIIDHHESPFAIEGSLTTIAKACRDVGVRVNASYGITDRWDDERKMSNTVSRNTAMTAGARRGLDECHSFIRSGGRGMVGVHAAFTCGDETLHAAADLANALGVGVHIHVAEGLDDIEASIRLHKLARDNWLLIHGVHLNEYLPGRIVHNPRSNMNNSVGYARPARFSNTVLLGTDGIGANMVEEARLAYAKLREDDISQHPETVQQWLHNSYELFPEALSDSVVWSYDHMDSAWHTAFTTSMHPMSIHVDGELVFDDGQYTKIDIAEIRTKAHEQSIRLFERLEA